MKKIKFWIDCVAGQYEGDFVVEDNTTKEEINSRISEKLNIRTGYDVEDIFNEN